MLHSILCLLKFLLLWPNDIFPVLVMFSQSAKPNKIIKEIQLAFFLTTYGIISVLFCTKANGGLSLFLGCAISMRRMSPQ